MRYLMLERNKVSKDTIPEPPPRPEPEPQQSSIWCNRYCKVQTVGRYGPPNDKRPIMYNETGNETQ